MSIPNKKNRKEKNNEGRRHPHRDYCDCLDHNPIIFTNTNTTKITRRSLLLPTCPCDLTHILGHHIPIHHHHHHHHHHQNHARSHSGHPTRLLARLPQAQERNEGHTTGAADHHGLRNNRDGDDGNDVMMMISLMTTAVRWMMVKVVKLVVFE